MSKQEQSKQIEAIYGYIKSIFTQKKKNKKNDTNENEDSDNEPVIKSANNKQKNEQIIKRRITFLKFLLSQLLNSKMRAQAAYFHIIASTAVYLFKLMQKIKEYERETIVFKNVLKKMLSKEWEFVMEQFGDCKLIKVALAKCIQSFDNKLSREQRKEINECNDDEKIKLNVNDCLRKNVVNYYSHIYIAKK